MESIVTMEVLDVRPPCVVAQPDAYERADHLTSRWVDPAWVEAVEARFYPGTLPQYLGPHLAGQPIVEPSEWWPPADPRV